MNSDKTLILFAHGAGAPSSSEWMKRWAKALGALGKVVSFDYDYTREGRKAPDRLPRLIERHRNVLARARTRYPGRNIVLCGKSMGSRVGCHLSLEEKVDALICLGYPLRGINGKMRDAVLKEMRTPILFVQGTRDALCPLDALKKARTKMRAKNSLHVVDAGDHSLHITVRHTRATGITQNDSDAKALSAISAFLDTL